jgi:RimJ/RimL family protein N-acetyltransferase
VVDNLFMPSLTEPVVASGRMRAKPQPTLHAEELVVRPWEAGDAPAVFAAYQDPAIQRWHVRSMTDLAEAGAWISSWPGRWREETGADWAVVAGATVVGRVGIKRLDLWEGIAELAYWVTPTARGRNTAGRALSAVSAWAVDGLGLHRFELIHATDNPASCRVAAKAGFPLEATLIRQGRHQDGWHDMHLHARLAD